jgi:aldehyde dehydrogenase (NAD+)
VSAPAVEIRANGAAHATYGGTLVARNLVGDEECDAADGRSFESRNPANLDDLCALAPRSGAEDVRRACAAAAAAAPGWADTPVEARAEVLRRAAALFERHRAELAHLVAREIGKALWAADGEVGEAVSLSGFYGNGAWHLRGVLAPTTAPMRDQMVLRRPVGVVGAITAGNFPLAVPMWKLYPAMLAGNPVVWKPSEDAPGTGYLVGRIFRAAGLPPGVLNVVHGYGPGEAGEALVAALDTGAVRMFAFTGSTHVGRRIGECAGRNLVVPVLELGGKNPVVILDDARPEEAAVAAARAAFVLAGQRCTSTGNIIVDRKVARAVRDKVVEWVSALRLGDPVLDREAYFGPLLGPRFLPPFLAHLDWGREGGARALGRTGRITAQSKPAQFTGDPDRGVYVWPTVWDGVLPEMRLAREEIFGPTVNLVEVDGLDGALAAATAPGYGLTSAVFTGSPRAARRFAERIGAGMTGVNQSGAGGGGLPFGGNGLSGNGTRELGVWGLEPYTRWQALSVGFPGDDPPDPPLPPIAAAVESAGDFSALLAPAALAPAAAPPPATTARG